MKVLFNNFQHLHIEYNMSIFDAQNLPVNFYKLEFQPIRCLNITLRQLTDPSHKKCNFFYHHARIFILILYIL